MIRPQASLLVGEYPALLGQLSSGSPAEFRDRALPTDFRRSLVQVKFWGSSAPPSQAVPKSVSLDGCMTCLPNVHHSIHKRSFESRSVVDKTFGASRMGLRSSLNTLHYPSRPSFRPLSFRPSLESPNVYYFDRRYPLSEMVSAIKRGYLLSIRAMRWILQSYSRRRRVYPTKLHRLFFSQATGV